MTARRALETTGLGLALGLAVFAPLLGSGVVLLLDYADYPVGPHPALPGSVWGFTPGLTSRGPVDAALVAAFRAVPWTGLRLAPWLAVPVLIAWGFQRLLRGGRLRVAGACLLYFVNPFVYERALAGQVYFLLGYALLPLLLAVLQDGRDSPAAAILGGVLLAVTVALAPHFAFIGGLPLVGCLASAALRRDARGAARLLLSGAAAAVCSLYWLLPAVRLAPRLQEITPADLSAFRSLPDAHVGLLPNLAGLYGFWREGWPLPKDSLPGWLLLLAAILAVVAAGYRGAFGDRDSRPPAVLLLGLGLAGLVLALGAQGPAGAAFTWVFDHAGAFRIMREPQKFLALVALAYAWGFGRGLEALARRAGGATGRVLVVLLLLAVPCTYTFRMFWGFGGYVRPSHYPASWAAADRLMGDGQGRILALPWHGYLPLAWAQGRVVSNPMPSYFGRETIAGDNAELGAVEAQSRTARSRYLEFLLEVGPGTRSFGNLLGPLGVRYVLLDKVLDWERYDWLRRQSDLRLVREWPDLVLFENLTPAAPAYAPEARLQVRDWGELVAVAARARLVGYDIRVEHARPGPVRMPEGRIAPGRSRPLRLEAASPVRYDVGGLPAGSTVVLSGPFDGQWTGPGGRAAANMGVTNSLRLGAGPDRSFRYGRWTLVRTGYLVSGAGVLLLLGLAVCLWARRGRRPSDAREGPGRRRRRGGTRWGSRPRPAGAAPSRAASAAPVRDTGAGTAPPSASSGTR